MRTFVSATLCAAALALLSTGPADAQQAWPTKPVTLIVPFPPGGTSDALGRMVTRKMGENLKQTFIVDNRPGGTGMIAARHVVKAAPDGYTLLGSGTYHAGLQSADFDQIKNFTHIAYFGGTPYVLVVHPSVPAKNLKEFLSYTASLPKGLSWASTGAGGQAHVLGEAFSKLTNANMVHIPYKGAAPAMTDLLGNRISAMFVTISVATQHIKAGSVRPLAMTTSGRLPDYPDVPTFAEQGYAPIIGEAWFGLSGPAAMPAPLVSRLNAEVQRVLASPEIKKYMLEQNMETRAMDSVEYTRFIAADIAHFAAK